jgi:hypothetical protein
VTDGSPSVDTWRRARWALVVLSAVFTSAVALLNDSPNGDLSRWYTDHLHHSYATWVMLHRGLAIYTQTFGQSLVGVDFPFPTASWPQMPGMVYPPGVFVIFMPLALVGRYVPMAASTFAVLSILWMLVLSHAAFVAVLRALESTRAARGLTLGFVAWMYLMWMGLEGFYDGAWVGCGAMMIHALARRRPVTALRWFAVVTLLHYRAVVLVPLGLAALYEALRGRSVRQWPWKDLVFVGVACLLCLGSFVLAYPVTSAYRETQQTLLQLHSGVRFWSIILLSVAAVGMSLWLADAVVAATVAIAGMLGLVYVNFWWHGAVLLFAPLAVAAFRPGRSPEVARALLIGWVLCIQPLAWRDHVTGFWTDLAVGFHPRR